MELTLRIIKNNLIAEVVQPQQVVTVTKQAYSAEIESNDISATIHPQVVSVETINPEPATVVVPRVQTLIATEFQQGLPGRDAAGLLQINTGPIVQGGTSIIDSIEISKCRACTWLLTVSDLTTNLFETSTISLVYDGSSASPLQQWGLSGYSFSYEIDTTIANDYLEVFYLNNHVTSVSISLVRIPTAFLS
jgi:hypothetical protein